MTRALPGAACGQRCGELRPPVEGVSALARLRLDVFGDDVEPFGRSEARDGFALGLDAEAASALAGGALVLATICPLHEPMSHY